MRRNENVGGVQVRADGPVGDHACEGGQAAPDIRLERTSHPWGKQPLADKEEFQEGLGGPSVVEQRTDRLFQNHDSVPITERPDKANNDVTRLEL